MSHKNSEEIFWLAINAYHEARGESFAGMKAVCHVVLNRAKRREQTVKEVVLAPMQFSWHNGGVFPAIKEYGSLCTAFKAAEEALSEWQKGECLHGADHYFADYIKPPVWAKEMKKVAEIGKHIFFRS